ncbi:VOC family protein [Thomasclavelia saccharogumia]|uniref:VOC family protein n=1 Tax=Thomasclavelia saccharogumia TaxID=341225 RepID=UPI00047A2885|nr:VOC family protein [Thomasclavelia saccharogumia]
MRLGTTYICVKDIEKSLAFYKSLLNQEPLYCNDDRWITFDCGNYLSLYNKQYDIDLVKNNLDSDKFNQAYLELLDQKERRYNDLVVFNFEVDNLKSEYQRLKTLKIGELSKICYVNVHMPYWYFTIKDPDGNVLEITGTYK